MMSIEVTIENILYFGAISLSLIGLFGMMMLQNVFRILLTDGMSAGVVMNDPVPQALVLTAIVIGVGVQALALALIFRVKRNYGTLDLRKIREKLEKDIAVSNEVSAPGSYQAPEKLTESTGVGQ